jgi:Flp pilus assembly protein TadB
MSSVVAASLAAALAASLAVPPRARPPRGPLPERRQPGDRALLLRARPVLSGLAFVGAWIFVGGAIGAVAGLAAAVVTWRVLGRAESPEARRRREELERDLPTAVHLLGACLSAGTAVSGALEAVADALPGAVAEELQVVHRRLALGGDPGQVWRVLGGHPQLGPLGRTLARAHQSGASVCAAVEALAAELAARSRARTDALARSVEVRAAAPLGVCFLPAFVLLGVTPMVVGVFSVMRLFG